MGAIKKATKKRYIRYWLEHLKRGLKMNNQKRKKLKNVVIAMLNDSELYYGGIFQKEAYYMKKYDLTQEEINIIWYNLYKAISIEE